MCFDFEAVGTDAGFAYAAATFAVTDAAIDRGGTDFDTVGPAARAGVAPLAPAAGGAALDGAATAGFAAATFTGAAGAGLDEAGTFTRAGGADAEADTEGAVTEAPEAIFEVTGALRAGGADVAGAADCVRGAGVAGARSDAGCAVDDAAGAIVGAEGRDLDAADVFAAAGAVT
jgi:hypothetical protein